MKFFICAFFLITVTLGFSQDQPGLRDFGFDIKAKDASINLDKYIKAASGYWYFDQFRFVNKRREMSFDDGKVVLILHSANEMFEYSKKLVSPLTIKDGAKYDEFVFAITLDGSCLKPMPITK